MIPPHLAPWLRTPGTGAAEPDESVAPTGADLGEAREGVAALALALVLLIAGGWWALALWPTDAGSAEWLVRTREVCFGAPRGGLPNGTGWALLVGQPAGLLVMLNLVWGEALRRDLRTLRRNRSGRVGLVAGMAFLMAGLGASAWRVADGVGLEREYQALLRGEAEFGNEPFSLETWPRLDLPVPSMALVDQHGSPVGIERFEGRVVLVTFAFGHCETICPLMVHNALTARDEVPDLDPVVLVVTLDPWRDLPSRLPHVASSWGMTGRDVHLLSGGVEEVERALDDWNVPRVRDRTNGDVNHPALTYVVDRSGRIAFATSGRVETLVGLLHRI